MHITANDPLDCGSLPNPENGTVTINMTTQGGIAMYTCNQGYGQSESVTRTCGSDSLWTHEAPTCSGELI